MTNQSFPPIGFLKSCFTEKFGVPRQSLMVDEATAILKLGADSRYRLAVKDLETFSHVWVIFVFHKNQKTEWRPLIEPPKEDLKEKVGVFASRSPDRPNPIGISVARLEKIDLDAPGGIEIHLRGLDLLDETPVLDIKPYVPYADSIPGASSGWAQGDIQRYAVAFSPASLDFLNGNTCHPRLMPLVQQMLEWDPRPTSQRKASPINAKSSSGLKFAFRILDCDVQWEIRDGGMYVTEIRNLKP